MLDPKRAMRTNMRAMLAQPRDWNILGNTLCNLAQSELAIGDESCVMGYIATQGELNLIAYLSHLASQSIRIAFPRVEWTTKHMDAVVMREFSAVGKLSVEPPKSRTLTPAFQLPTPPAAWVQTRHNLWQPHDELAATPLAEIAIVLVPGLAFDVSGGRLGRGGGFYDRFLARLRTHNSHCKCIGVCLDEQIVATVPMNVDSYAQDMRMDMIITPTRLIACR